MNIKIIGEGYPIVMLHGWAMNLKIFEPFVELFNIKKYKFKAKNFEDLAYFEPFYLKDFIAIPSKKN